MLENLLIILVWEIEGFCNIKFYYSYHGIEEIPEILQRRN